MDDIWRTDVWRKISEVLPDVMNGSRVLTTTRFVEVANSADPGIQPLMLPFLNDDESLVLFTKKVFPGSTCPEELKMLARQMVKKCRGLPLALVVLGGILSKKLPTPLVWLKVFENMDWESTEEGNECLNILALSYNNLPNHYLKSCFLYMGLFPEDSEIRASRLAMLWIAEGFIPQRESETMEDTANGYLEELVQRSLIQVTNRRMYDGGISRCRIHDVMRDMCLGEAKQVGFLNVIHSSSSNGGSVSVSRRLAFLNPSLSEDTENNYSRYLTSNPNLRSMSITEHSTSRYMSLYGLKLLRVLQKTNYDHYSLKMMKEIASMTHLRYLELVDWGNWDIIQIPSSIRRFRYLQTLMLGTNFLIKGGQLELPNLRHLFLPNNKECCPSITMSTMLQKLENIYGNKIWIERNLLRLTNLRQLSMTVNFMEDDANTLYAALGNLHLLASLKLTLRAKDKLSADTILTALAQNHHLFKLVLDAEISERRLPTSSSVFPPNLTMLCLSGSKMGEDPMPVLEKLPNLMLLIFSEDAYVGEEIVCTKGGFPRLQELKFESLWEIQHWIIEDGSFPNLTSLQIYWCEKLTMLPELQYVRSLKELILKDSRREFRDKLRGEDWYKIKDVPSIHIGV